MFQDIRLPRKSLREVLPKGELEHSSRIKKSRKVEAETEMPPPPSPVRRSRRSGGGSGKWIWSAIILVLLVAGGFFLSRFFAQATVTVTPKHYEVALSGSAFTVPYEMVDIPALKDSRLVSVKAASGPAKKASGVVVIYNNYSSAPQTLIVNTRLASAAGKIYHLTKQVTVPGTKKNSNGQVVAGSVEASVVADQTGAAYNSSLTDFTIPGFKGDPRYNKFSAKSKTPLSGGSDGQTLTLADETQQAVLAGLKKSLLGKALEQVNFQVPDNFVVYASSILPTWKEDLTPLSGGRADQATLTLSLSGRAIIFDRETLGRILAASVIPAGDQTPFVVTNLESLGIVPNQDSLKSDDEKVTIIASGQAEVKLTVDPSVLRAKLVGLDASRAEAVFKEFPALEKAGFNFQPPWVRTFPTDPQKIKVVVS